MFQHIKKLHKKKKLEAFIKLIVTDPKEFWDFYDTTTQTDIANQTGLPVSTVSIVIKTLKEVFK